VGGRGRRMVEFCPKCGTVLIPKKKKETIYLVCKNCGYSKKLESKKGYKSKHKVEEEKKTKILVMEATPQDKEKIVEEKELLQEYYEILLETMEQEQAEEF